MKVGIVSSVFALCVAVAATVSPAAAEAVCRLAHVATLPMTVLRSGRIGVPMTVGGKALTMLVDTGGVLSMLTPEAAANLDLTPEPVPSTTDIEQFGGLKIDHYVTARGVSLANLKAGNFKFLIMPHGGYLPDEDGLLGPDVLSGFDVEFDFANETLNLFEPNDCSEGPVYWTHDPYAQVDVSLDNSRHITIPVTIDGKAFKALLDTGASETVANLEKVEDAFGLGKESLTRIEGAAPERPRYRYHFKSLSFEGVTVNNPHIELLPETQKQSGGPDILLGMNVLRRLHLYIAYGKRQVYLTSASAH